MDRSSDRLSSPHAPARNAGSVNAIIITVVFVLLFFPSLLDAQHYLYLSPGGSDENPGTIALPLKTLHQARLQVAAMNAVMTEDIIVVMRDGIYMLDSTLTFGPHDSGTNGYFIRYQAFPGEHPVISGGRRIGDWMQHGTLWRSPVDAMATRSMYVDGHRAQRARKENTIADLQQVNGGFTTSDTSVAFWRNVEEIECIFPTHWIEQRAGIASIQNGKITMKQPAFDLALNHPALPPVRMPVWFENAPEFLDEQGEWYLDRFDHLLSYMPKPGQTMASAEVILPVLEQLIVFNGTLDHPVRNVAFSGITFSHTTWSGPSSNTGFPDIQATVYANPAAADINDDTQWLTLPAAVELRGASNISFTRCVFSRLGAAGFEIASSADSCSVVGNVFTDISGAAIQVGSCRAPHPDDPREVVRNVSIVNNFIHSIGVEFRSAPAILAFYTDKLRIAHNEIAHLPYTGISLGWGWGLQDLPGNPTPSNGNVIEHNLVYDVMNALNDGGGIYTLGSQPDCLIRGNYVHHVHAPYGALYLDEGSAWIQADSNALLHNWGTLMMKGSAHSVLHNYWDNPGSIQRSDVGSTFANNNIVSSETEIPASILQHAGIEPEYRDILTAAPSAGNRTRRPTAVPTLSAYPSPANGTMTVCFTPLFSGAAEIVLWDILGRESLRAGGTVTAGEEQRIKVSIDHLSTGIYVVRFVNGSAVSAPYKVMIIR